VVSYDEEGLSYLGTVDIDSGKFYFEPYNWGGLSTEVMYEGSYLGIFLMKDRENAEGLVVVTEDGRRVKYKYDEYVRLHRIVSDLTPKRVWEAMGGPFMDVAERMAADIPEEHSNWLLAEANELVGQYISCATYLSEIAHRTAKITTRKEKALAVKNEEPWVKACYFAALDGKRFDQILWKFLEPKGDA
jgi:RNA ligase